MRIIVDRHGRLLRAAVIDRQDRLVDLHVDRVDRQPLYGGIYRGRLVRLLAQQSGAFIDIGTAQLAWIDKTSLKKAHRLYSDKDLLKPGSSVIVQVHREAVGSKGAVVHCDIGLVGRLVVWMPLSCGVRHSRRATATPLPTSLRERLDNLSQSGGWVVRSAGIHCSFETILAEAHHLLTQWQQCLETNKEIPVPAQLVPPLSAPIRAILESAEETLNEVIVDTPQLMDKIKLCTDRWIPEVSSILTRYHGDHGVFDAFGLEETFRLLIESRVPLARSAELVIEVTEALIAIDVNGQGDDNPLSINLHAAVEIVRQLRLRNLGGMIIVDFLRMRRKDDQKRVTDTMQKALANDPIRTDIYGWTRLGLLEMTRVRRGYSLTEVTQDDEELR